MSREGRRRSTLPVSQQTLSRSPNGHQRRSSGLQQTYQLPLSQDIFFDDSSQHHHNHRSHVKRSKSANTILVNHEGVQDIYATRPSEQLATAGESEGSDDPMRPDEMAKTKAARAQSEHRRRVELKESFERLRIALGVPQPRAGKKDLVEQAIVALEYFKRKETEMMNEINYLRGNNLKYGILAGGANLVRPWAREVHEEDEDEMEL
jgi:hypothetical protein